MRNINQKIRLANPATWLLLALAIFLCLPVSAKAQSNYTPSELDTLVSNIALYPDPLLVQVLTASTYGNQIPAANAWAQSHRSLKGESLSAAIEQANLSYDPSVQALLPFPTVLAMMDKYKTWTDQLGDAVSAQKDDVMDAVQRLRQSAQAHGHLASNDKVSVQQEEKNIVIVPVKTEYVYVPVYNPRVVYYTYADGYTRITYGSGVWLGGWFGEWGWGSCYFDWGPRIIYVRNTRWYAHRPIPHHPRRYVPPRHHGYVPVTKAHAVPAARAATAPAARGAAAPAPRTAPGTRVVPAPGPHTAAAPAPHAAPNPRAAAPAPAKQEIYRSTSQQDPQQKQGFFKPVNTNQDSPNYGNVRATSRGNSEPQRNTSARRNNWEEDNRNSGRNDNSRNGRNGGFKGSMRR